MIIWEATNGAYITRENLVANLTSLEVSHDGFWAFVGSDQGVLWIFNVSNWSMPKLIKIEKYSNFAVTVLKESPKELKEIKNFGSLILRQMSLNVSLLYLLQLEMWLGYSSVLI